MFRSLFLAGVAAALFAALQFVSSAEASPGYFSIIAENCGQGGGVSMTVGWYGNDPSSLQQRVDISLANNGWQLGTFASGTTSGVENMMAFNGLASGTTYYARVLQLPSSGYWDSSATYVFTTSSACAVIVAPPPLPPVTRTNVTETQGIRTNTPNAPVSTAGVEWLGTAAVSNKRVRRGTTLDIGASAKASADSVGLIDIEVYGPNGTKVFQQSYDNVSLTAGKFKSYINHWAVPANLPPGTYTVKVGVFTPGFGTLRSWNDQAATVEVY